MDIKGKYSQADGKITFVSKGQVAFGADVTFYVYDQDTDKESVVHSISCSWNGNGFTFDPNITIALPAGSNSFYFKAGYFSLTRLEEDPGLDPQDGWTTLGIGLMMDGWLMPAFKDLDQSKYIYRVEIQSKDGETGIYRVVDPYGPATPLASVNESKASHGFIEFNVSDPDNVYFYGTDAGFANSQLGITKFYPNNTLGFLIGSYPEYEIQTIIEMFGKMEEYISSTYKDGVVTVPSKAMTGGGYSNDANFGIQGARFAGNGWQNAGKPKNMEARIVFPDAGVEDVKIKISAPVRYFNLQGTEVEHPSKGVYIRVQGTEAKKIIF